MDFSPIPFDSAQMPDEFFEWFRTSWCIHNNAPNLRSPLENQVAGAWVEWNYIQRGAVEDHTKYRDVLVDGVPVDCKFVHVKFSREALYQSIHARTCLEKRGFYCQVGIQEVHFWSHLKEETVLKPWFIYYPGNNSVTFFDEMTSVNR